MNKFISAITLTTGTAFTIALTAITPSRLADIIPLEAISTHPVLGETSIDLGTFRNAALPEHNTYRAKHHSPDLTLSDSLNNTAQSWAEHLASNPNGGLEHSSPSQRNDAGENLYVSYTTESSMDPSTLAKAAVDSWYNEVSSYNYDNPGFSSGTGHFTQVVWKSSTQLGCGAAQGNVMNQGSNYKAYYVVCHYAPAGNVQGQFPENVLKP